MISSREHLWHYFLLILVLASGFIGFLSFPHDTGKRFLSLLGATLGYVFWGAWHHFVEKRLTLRVFSEYLLLALVVLASVGLLLFPF